MALGKVALKEFFGKVILWAVNASGTELEVLAETDGSIRAALVGHDGTNLKNLKTETTATAAELIVSNYGKVSTTLTAFALDTNGEQKITLHGKDEAGNVDPLRTDPAGVLWMRSYEQSVIAPPQILAAADAVLWSPPAPASSAELYEIDFLLVNVAGAVTGPISMGIDIGASGSLAIPEFWVYQEILPWPGSSGWRGTFLCRGADTIRGWNAAGANLSTVHFRIRRIDTNI